MLLALLGFLYYFFPFVDVITSPISPKLTFLKIAAVIVLMRLLTIAAACVWSDAKWEVIWSAIPNRYPDDEATPKLISRLTTWDSAHYIYLSKHWYSHNSPSCAFYPLWPFMIRVATLITRLDYGWVSFAMANMIYLSIVLILAKRFVDNETFWGWVLWLCAPNGFDFHFPYSESICFLLVMYLFFSLRERHIAGACIAGILLPLSRPVGIFCLPVLILNFVYLRKAKWLIPVALAGVGYLVYLLNMRIFTGDYLEGFSAQNFYANKPSVSNAFNIQAIVDRLFKFDLTLTSGPFSLIDRLLFVLTIIAVPFIIRGDPKLGLWVMLVAVFPGLTNWFLSYRRFSLLAFPVYLFYGNVLNVFGSKLPCVVYCGVGLCIQLVQLYNHCNFKWAG